MAENQKFAVIISSGTELLMEMKPSMSEAGINLICVPNLKYAAEKISSSDCIALIADFGWLPPTEREAVIALHNQHHNKPLFILETVSSMAPAINSSLRRLSWPLPTGFADQVRVIARLIVIITEQILFSTGAVQKAFQDAGVRIISIETLKELSDFINDYQANLKLETENKKTKKSWTIIGEKEENNSIIEQPPHLVVFKFSGNIKESYTLDFNIRENNREAICYYVSGIDFEKYALEAIKEKQPVSLSRDQARRIASVLVGEDENIKLKLKNRGKERILLIDNFKPTLTNLRQALIGAGYDVVASMDAEESLKMCHKGAFHLAVIGTAITFAEHSGAELAQKMREIDPDLRIIFMVDQYPLHAALKGISQVVELGLDDAILKPVEASRLLFSVEKALERRFLLLENERLLKETQELNRQLSMINSFQKKFFATVAHDVKSPLTAIMGYSEVLTAKLKNLPDLQRYASNILSSAKTLNILISDLVDLAAIESGKLRVEMGELNLLVVIKDVYERVQIAAQKRNITLLTELPPSFPPLVGDNARIGQVIQNLCTNAIQYTKEGGKVTIKAEVFPDKVVVSVIDTGIGIAKEDLPRVWERFFQTKQAQDMRKAGFGLGLKIAREIVQRHGGEMGLESELGVGSRFFFHIPTKKMESPPPANQK